MFFILRRSLIFFTLMLAGLVLYAIWYGNKADRYEETAIPYLEKAIPRLTSWQYEQLKPLLSASARADFENERVRAAYRSYDRLGRFQSMDKPLYKTSRHYDHPELGDIEEIEYQAELQFDTGPAALKIKLVANGKSYHIRHFGFQSKVFADKSAGN